MKRNNKRILLLFLTNWKLRCWIAEFNLRTAVFFYRSETPFGVVVVWIFMSPEFERKLKLFKRFPNESGIGWPEQTDQSIFKSERRRMPLQCCPSSSAPRKRWLFWTGPILNELRSWSNTLNLRAIKILHRGSYIVEWYLHWPVWTGWQSNDRKYHGNPKGNGLPDYLEHPGAEHGERSSDRHERHRRYDSNG